MQIIKFLVVLLYIAALFMLTGSLMEGVKQKFMRGQLHLADVGIISIISGLVMLIAIGAITPARLKEIYKKGSETTGDWISKLTADSAKSDRFFTNFSVASIVFGIIFYLLTN